MSEPDPMSAALPVPPPADDGLRRRRLYLVRHGDVSYFDAQGQPLDPRQVSLSTLGMEQACSLASVLQGTVIDRILCSDLPRAVQTAEILAQSCRSGHKPELEPDLREIRAGRLRDIPAGQRQARLAYPYDGAERDDASFIGGERFADFEQRVLAVLSALLDDAQWDSALWVSHDAVNRIVLCWAAGQGRDAMKAFEQDPCCLNIVDIDMVQDTVRRRLIRCVNFTPYDPAKQQSRLTGMEKVFQSYRPNGEEGNA